MSDFDTQKMHGTKMKRQKTRVMVMEGSIRMKKRMKTTTLPRSAKTSWRIQEGIWDGARDRPNDQAGTMAPETAADLAAWNAEGGPARRGERATMVAGWQMQRQRWQTPQRAYAKP